MAITKQIVCLANSRKPGGSCVAGRESVAPHSWIRPVSNRPREEVSDSEQQYEGGGQPELLDVFDVPLLASHPRSYQPENWLLDASENWTRVGRLTWDDLAPLASIPTQLWTNEYSTNNGVIDRIPVSLVSEIHDSLRLLYVPSLEIRVSQHRDDDRQRVQGRFEFAGAAYGLWVTDPVAEQHYRSLGNGTYTPRECYLTVSVGEESNGYHYKLIAAVIERP